MFNYPQRCEPWCWYIYLQNWVISRANVGKYSSTMEHMGTRCLMGCARVNIKVGYGLSHQGNNPIPSPPYIWMISFSVYISILDCNDPALICPNSLLPKLTYDNPYSNIFKPLSITPCWPSTNHNFRVCCTPMLEGWHRHDILYAWFPNFS
jgi:hypothetical protein